jgi:hypothetical protein
VLSCSLVIVAITFARRLRALGTIAAVALIGSCAVPHYSFDDDNVDSALPDAGQDVVEIPDAPIDQGSDALPDVPPAGCSSSQECTQALPVCDPSTKTCVKCTYEEGCPAGTYCDANKCVAGCKEDKHCVAGGGIEADAGDDGGEDASAGAADASSDGEAVDAGDAADAETDAEPAEAGGGVKCDTATNQCVGCTGDQDCPPGTLCDEAICVFGCSPTKSCPTGFDCCSGQCADLLSSLEHCGACDALCDPPGAGGQCDNGICKATGCSAGFGDCDGNPNNGCEAELASDAANCGGCSKPCAAKPNASPKCEASACVLGDCKQGFADCDFNPDNGCEVNVLTNASHCGTCDNLCNLLNAVELCEAGVCKIQSCEGNWFDCDGVALTGCEKDLDKDPLNCGTCGKICPSSGGTATCIAKTCALSGCVAPYLDCNGLVADGCEVNKNTDAKNCGDCGTVCNLQNAQSICSNGKCAIDSCNAGFADCDGLVDNGCEVNTNTNPDHCGGCAAACSKNNGAPTCALGACSIACNPGFENCDANVANGCEINTSSNTDNCGSCGNICSATGGTPNCVIGKCGISACNTPLADCDANAANGCEVNTAGDIKHCGGCGKECFIANGTAGCTGGTCNIASCNAGYADCNGFHQDGCEASLSTLLNCAQCGQLCVLPNANATCATGSCEIASCQSPFGNCDSNTGNG